MAFPKLNIITISDGDFSNWTFGSWIYHEDKGQSATMTVESYYDSKSYKGRMTRINATTHNTQEDAGAGAYGIKSDFSTSLRLAGSPYRLTLAVLKGPGAFGDGQGMGLVVEQNKSVYMAYTHPGIVGIPSVWTTKTFTGMLVASTFVKVKGSGPAYPDFSSGVPTKFGFSGSNTWSITVTMYYDDFKLDIGVRAKQK